MSEFTERAVHRAKTTSASNSGSFAAKTNVETSQALLPEGQESGDLTPGSHPARVVTSQTRAALLERLNAIADLTTHADSAHGSRWSIEADNDDVGEALLGALVDGGVIDPCDTNVNGRQVANRLDSMLDDRDWSWDADGIRRVMNPAAALDGAYQAWALAARPPVGQSTDPVEGTTVRSFVSNDYSQITEVRDSAGRLGATTRPAFERIGPDGALVREWWVDGVKVGDDTPHGHPTPNAFTFGPDDMEMAGQIEGWDNWPQESYETARSYFPKSWLILNDGRVFVAPEVAYDAALVDFDAAARRAVREAGLSDPPTD